MRVALVHDWLTGMRGGEYVFEAIAELFPRADLFTLLAVPGSMSRGLSVFPRHTSWLQNVPGIENRYRHFLPLMPAAIESFDLTGFDLVVSSSHCVAKGIRKAPGAVHVSYVHSPMRYVWDRYDDYFGAGRASPWVRLAARLVRRRLQDWDRRTSAAARVDFVIANSRFIASRIEAAWNRTAHVIHPFVDLERFHLSHAPRTNYVAVGAFAPYKRVDIAIEAFNRLKAPLLVAGTGQDEERLRALAGPTVQFVGPLSNPAVADMLGKAKALIFPGIEDFGITPLEAMASGTPVIAFGEGGALDSVTRETGLFFRPQTVEALMEAVTRLESGAFAPDRAACRARAEEFSRGRFQNAFATAVREAWSLAGKGEADLEGAMRPPV